MIVVTHILIDNSGKTVGAEFNIDGRILRFSTEQLKKRTVKAENAIIDKNGFVRSKRGELTKIVINNRPNVVENSEMMQAKKLLSLQEIKIYHGNKDINLIPTFGKGKIKNDYGQGFYTTPDIELAREWAWGTYTRGDKAYVHTYRLKLKSLNILNFTELSSLHWIAELLSNRKVDYGKYDVAIDRVKKFVQKYKCDTSKYDIIIGYRADDSYFDYAVAFARGLIYLDTMENALRYGNLGLQVFIKSKKAFSCLTKICVEEVDRKYEDMYKARDKKANSRYERLKKNQVSRKKETIADFI